MSTVAAILAAGSGSRFGADKTRLTLEGLELWRHSFNVFTEHPGIDHVFLVVSEGNADIGREVPAILGGATRQQSVAAAVRHAHALGADHLLVHDAARPFVTAPVIESVLKSVLEGYAAAPGTPVTDTIKRVEGNRIVETPARESLRAVQTPQGAPLAQYLTALSKVTTEHTDDLALISAAGFESRVVSGDPANIKITTPRDYEIALLTRTRPDMRTGLGYDIHRFTDDPKRDLWLGGVRFEDAPALEGHSDADVVLHAVTDALLGALSLGDIGQHFPNTDPRWKGQASSVFVDYAAKLVREAGYRISQLDIAIQAEKPKIMRRAEEMRLKIAGMLGVQIDRVSIKATTNEGLGAIGRGEGICAYAVATLQHSFSF